MTFTSLLLCVVNIQDGKSGEADLEGEKVVIVTDSEGTGTDSDSESEHHSSDQSPVSGSVHYFIAPLESAKTQAMVIEELNQVRCF